ncbi:unnamed protein product [Orchesella dallaii]|uniref:Uncharacterized protein n=1 Tax=Orchesella dallaii TaxID=48710 RepID=A0ABP1RMZ3_9HEXA
MTWVTLGLLLLCAASSFGELEEVPEGGITYKVKYDVNQFIVHAQDLGYDLKEARSWFYLRDHPPSILTIANFDPEFTINMVRKDLNCLVRFKSGVQFNKANFLFFKAAKSVYTVEANVIRGVDIFDKSGEQLMFVATLKRRGLELVIATKSRTSKFYFPVATAADIDP